MINTSEAIDFLIKEYNVEEFVGVPCSYLKNLINEVTNRGIYKSFFNEGDAVAYAVGRQIANPSSRICLLIQNSGIGNAVNPITSLSEIYKIPLLMIVGNRKPIPEEPQHSVMGEITSNLLMTIMMDTEVGLINLVHTDEDSNLTPIPESYKKDSIIYLVEDKDVFSEVELNEVESIENSDLTYEKVIEAFQELRDRGREFILVTTTGYTSRVAYLKDSDYNFYNVGAMGCAWSVANGLAKNKRNVPVICLDGDGAYFMRQSSAKTFEGPSRCVRVILKNGTYRSTGGQSLQLGNPDEGLRTVEELSALVNLLDKWISSGEDWSGDSVEIIINNEAPKDLPRPTQSTHELKWRLSKAINPGIEIPEEDVLGEYTLPDDVIEINPNDIIEISEEEEYSQSDDDVIDKISLDDVIETSLD